MPGKLDLYNLGDVGVSLVDSAVHAADGSYTRAQNVSVSLVGGQHGIRKRPGLRLLTGTSMAGGSVLAIINVPFPLPPGPGY